MATHTMTISLVVDMFALAPSSKYNSMIYGQSKWGYGDSMVISSWKRQVLPGMMAVTGTVEDINKTRDGTFYYVFPFPSINGEDQIKTEWIEL